MKDAKQLLEQATFIKSINTGLNVSIIVSGPVCSKTTFFLAENNIKIITE